MEKRAPHYDLTRVQADVARLGAAAFTKTAMDGGRAMGLTSAEMLTVIASLTRRNFYKSMTTYADHRVWQDVYHCCHARAERGLHQDHIARSRAGDPVQGEMSNVEEMPELRKPERHDAL